MLTSNEFKILRAIDASEYGDALTEDVWTFTLANHSDLSGKTISGTVSSLSQKGFVRVGGRGKEQYIGITAAGAQEYIAAHKAAGTEPHKSFNS